MNLTACVGKGLCCNRSYFERTQFPCSASTIINRLMERLGTLERRVRVLEVKEQATRNSARAARKKRETQAGCERGGTGG